MFVYVIQNHKDIKFSNSANIQIKGTDCVSELVVTENIHYRKPVIDPLKKQ